MVVRVLRCHQNNVEVARQGTVLKAVVEQMQLRPELRFREKSGLVPILPDDHGNLQLARNQQRLVAKLLRQACRIDQSHSFGLAAIPT